MFKVDDGFYDHPKVRSIPRGAARKGAVTLWTFAGSWSSRYLQDGLIPCAQVEELGGTIREAEWLIAATLWHAVGHSCDKCPPVPAEHYVFHDWPESNDLKVDVEKRRDKARDRMRKMRSGDGKDSDNQTVRGLFARTDNERARSL